jgi:hypothetical protein
VVVVGATVVVSKGAGAAFGCAGDPHALTTNTKPATAIIARRILPEGTSGHPDDAEQGIAHDLGGDNRYISHYVHRFRIPYAAVQGF